MDLTSLFQGNLSSWSQISYQIWIVLIDVVLFILHIFLRWIFVSVIISIIFGCLHVTTGIGDIYVKSLIKLFEWVHKRRLEKDGTLSNEERNQPINTAATCRTVEKPEITGPETALTLEDFLKKTHSLKFHSTCSLMRSGMEAIVQDSVTSHFDAEELVSWNLLTRTSKSYHHVGCRLGFIWLLSFVFRHWILFPMRFILILAALLWSVVGTTYVGYIKDEKRKRKLNKFVVQTACRTYCRAFSAIIRYHDRENRPKSGSICVANHTSTIDVILLLADRIYSLVGQKHVGLLGSLQDAMDRASHHIWFERQVAKDRALVRTALKEHVEKEDAPPVLIFPEGVVLSNKAVMMFKKGSFEVGCPVYPVAIKFDQRFGDPFWGEFSHLRLMYEIMTAWAIVADVYYLPPMYMQENEDSTAFARRVRHEICLRGGLVDLDWDGMLKHNKANVAWKNAQQKNISDNLKETLSSKENNGKMKND